MWARAVSGTKALKAAQGQRRVFTRRDAGMQEDPCLLLQRSISELWTGLVPVECRSSPVHHIPRGKALRGGGALSREPGGTRAVPLRAQFGTA